MDSHHEFGCTPYTNARVHKFHYNLWSFMNRLSCITHYNKRLDPLVLVLESSQLIDKTDGSERIWYWVALGTGTTTD